MHTPALLLSLLILSGTTHAQLTLVETGGTFRTDAINLALAANAIADSQYGGPHLTSKINDGLYGNANSWLASASFFYGSIGLEFATPISIGSLAFGRDNTGAFTDRAHVPYEIQLATTHAYGTSIGYGNWFNIGILDYFVAPPEDPASRHLYDLGTVWHGITAIRFNVPGPANQEGYQGAVIDEIEIYATGATSAIPEPSTYAALAGFAALGLALWSRRRAALST